MYETLEWWKCLGVRHIPRQVNQEVPENRRFTFSPFNPLQDDDQYRDAISLPDSTHGTLEVGAESPGQR